MPQPGNHFWLYSLHFRTPHLAKLQGQTIAQFLKHECDVFLVSTSCGAKDANNLHVVAEELNDASGPGKRFHILTLPARWQWHGKGSCDERHPSVKEGSAYNWCIHEHMQKQRLLPTYVGLMHGDMLLVNPFDARAYLDVRGIYGQPVDYRPQNYTWVLHPQLMFIRLDRWRTEAMERADFRPVLFVTDVGGRLGRHLPLRGGIERWKIPKRSHYMFKDLNLIGTFGVEEALSGPLSTFNEQLIDVNLALARHSFDPLTNKTPRAGAQYEQYEVFGDAWVHTRHSKFLSLAVRGVDIAWTPHLKERPWWAHPKNAYMKGLVDCRLWLMCNVNARNSTTMPSGRTLKLEPLTLKFATLELVSVASDPRRGPRHLVQPDNAYLKGCLDASMCFWGREQTTGFPLNVTTWPSGGPC